MKTEIRNHKMQCLTRVNTVTHAAMDVFILGQLWKGDKVTEYLGKYNSLRSLEWYCLTARTLKFSMLGKKFRKRYFETFFLFFFPRKLTLTFHANCLFSRQFT